MKKESFFASLFFNSEKIIESIQSKLQDLEKEMKKIDAMENKVEAIVRLFQVISPIEDAGGFSEELYLLKKHNRKGNLDCRIRALETLNLHFDQAGRSDYGLNRTKVGEEVTTNNVFPGNVYGIWTKPASYWLAKKTELEKSLRPDWSKDKKNPISDWYLINKCQCGSFVESHTKGILKQIQLLKVA